MAEYKMMKYPRTPHLEGSRLQPGDEDLEQVQFTTIIGKTIAVEEKCDGANSAVSFDKSGELLLQSRGHYLIGGAREKHFDLFKQWATIHQRVLYEVLGTRYIMFGEWLYAKHSVFYDLLAHYFQEFDILDREKNVFLDTPSRHKLLAGLPVISVPVLCRQSFKRLSDLTSFVGPSNYIHENHMELLIQYCQENGLDASVICSETDPTTTMEGLYLKIEDEGTVVDRLKYVRRSFLQAVLESGTHWLNRPIIPNRLSYPLEAIFEDELPQGIKTIVKGSV